VPHTTILLDHFRGSQVDFAAEKSHPHPQMLNPNFGCFVAHSAPEFSSSFLILNA
jgi:hypothetical protein